MSEITKALVAARKAISPTVYKAGKNEAQRYAYAGHEHVVTHARAAMLANGLALEQVRVTHESVMTYSTRNGEQIAWLWRGDFALLHASGESRSYSFLATTAANDKAAYVASTALDRTAILRVMQLAGSTEEDPEHDSNDQSDGPHQSDTRRHAVATGVQSHVDGALALCTSREMIVRWARELTRMSGDKTMAWQAFAAQCAILELSPKEIASEARK